MTRCGGVTYMTGCNVRLEALIVPGDESLQRNEYREVTWTVPPDEIVGYRVVTEAPLGDQGALGSRVLVMVFHTPCIGAQHLPPSYDLNRAISECEGAMPQKLFDVTPITDPRD